MRRVWMFLCVWKRILSEHVFDIEKKNPDTTEKPEGSQ